MVQYKFLTESDRAHFLSHGYIKIPGAIPSENVEAFTKNVWTRLGWDPKDQSTWIQETVHMPRHREVPTRDFMPKAYAAACESGPSIQSAQLGHEAGVSR